MLVVAEMSKNKSIAVLESNQLTLRHKTLKTKYSPNKKADATIGNFIASSCFIDSV